MSKRMIGLVVSVLLIALLAGCAAYSISPVTGIAYTEVKAPMTATSAEKGTKVGTAMIQSILGLVAVGDASIETAMKNGGITKVSHVDYFSKSILGIYATFTVYVYGE